MPRLTPSEIALNIIGYGFGALLVVQLAAFLTDGVSHLFGAAL